MRLARWLLVGFVAGAVAAYILALIEGHRAVAPGATTPFDDALSGDEAEE